MAKELKGVGGVLGGLISPEPTPPAKPTLPPQAEAPALPLPLPAKEPEAPAATPAKAAKKPGERIAARRGRPLGVDTTVTAGRSKVSLNLDTELMDTYREWSWDERCQFNELVERALRQHLKSRRPRGQ